MSFVRQKVTVFKNKNVDGYSIVRLFPLPFVNRSQNFESTGLVEEQWLLPLRVSERTFCACRESLKLKHSVRRSLVLITNAFRRYYAGNRIIDTVHMHRQMLSLS